MSSLSDFFSEGGTDSSSGLSDQGRQFGFSLWNQMNNPNAFNPGSASYNAVSPTMQLDDLGLTTGQRQGFDQAVKTALGQFSGNAASNGFLTPQNAGSIAGSAAQYVMPQFAPLMSANLNNLFGQRMQNSVNSLNTDMFNRQLGLNSQIAKYGALNNLLGQYQTSNMTQRGPGLGNQMAMSSWENMNEMFRNIGSAWGGGGGGGVK